MDTKSHMSAGIGGLPRQGLPYGDGFVGIGLHPSNKLLRDTGIRATGMSRVERGAADRTREEAALSLLRRHLATWREELSQSRYLP